MRSASETIDSLRSIPKTSKPCRPRVVHGGRSLSRTQGSCGRLVRRIAESWPHSQPRRHSPYRCKGGRRTRRNAEIPVRSQEEFSIKEALICLADVASRRDNISPLRREACFPLLQMVGSGATVTELKFGRQFARKARLVLVAAYGPCFTSTISISSRTSKPCPPDASRITSPP